MCRGPVCAWGPGFCPCARGLPGASGEQCTGQAGRPWGSRSARSPCRVLGGSRPGPLSCFPHLRCLSPSGKGLYGDPQAAQKTKLLGPFALSM